MRKFNCNDCGKYMGHAEAGSKFRKHLSIYCFACNQLIEKAINLLKRENDINAVMPGFMKGLFG